MSDSITSSMRMGRLERGAEWGLRHWLLIVNSGAALYAGLPWLSPLAKCTGHPLIGDLLFRLYTPLCHQKPERSFFFCGHQVGFCHRCAAMYTSILVAVAMLLVVYPRVERDLARGFAPARRRGPA